MKFRRVVVSVCCLLSLGRVAFVLCRVGSPHVFVIHVTVSVASPIFSHFVLFCPVICSQRCQDLLLTSVRVLALSTYRWTSLPTRRNIRPRDTALSVLSCPFCPFFHRDVYHRQRNWAVSTDSHMQQDGEISKSRHF